jgi:hypothetical protein
MAQGEWKRTTDLIERAVLILTEQWPMPGVEPQARDQDMTGGAE